MLKIGLWSDSLNFPSLPLMKLSAYYKNKYKNCTVKLIDSFFERFDIVYCSKVFNLPAITKIPQLPQSLLANEIYMGGTGFAIFDTNNKEHYIKENDLPHDIEHTYPDYGLYPELTKDTAFGFLTRGCPNACGFCVVSKKEGLKSVHSYYLSEFWHGQPNIKLMDANLLACDNAEELLMELIMSNANIDFTQGLDARLVDEHTAGLLSKLKIKMLHFAFDIMQHESRIIRGLRLFSKHSTTNSRNRKVYILTNYNTTHAEDWYRVKKVIELGYRPDIRIYRKGTHPQFLTDLARWANLSRLYRSCSFEDYIPRKDGKRCKDMYSDILAS